MPESKDNIVLASGRVGQDAPAGSSDEAPSSPRSRVGRWVFRLLVVVGLAVGLGYLPLQVFGEKGLVQYRRLQRELSELKARNRRMGDQIHQMRIEVSRLRGDEATIERAARQDLGVVRPGELVFVVEE